MSDPCPSFFLSIGIDKGRARWDVSNDKYNWVRDNGDNVGEREIK